MSNKAMIITAFIFGAVVGAAVAFRYVAKKMDNEYDEIFDEESYDAENDNSVVTITEDKRSAADLAKNKRDITEYASRLREESYSSDDAEEPENVETIEAPYVITPEEFGECGYETISLTYYSDSVLADENDEIVDDKNDVVGKDFESHFGEFESDSVYVRNDRRKCDYEILRDYGSYNDP